MSSSVRNRGTLTDNSPPLSELQTTTCCYYGSLHLDATKELARIVHEYGTWICDLGRSPEVLTYSAQVNEHSLGWEDPAAFSLYG